MYCQLNEDLCEPLRLKTGLCIIVLLTLYILHHFLYTHFKCLMKTLVVNSLTEAYIWTSLILPSVPSTGCPSTARGLCTQLTCPPHMSLWWGIPLQARWEKNIYVCTENNVYWKLQCAHLSTRLHIEYFYTEEVIMDVSYLHQLILILILHIFLHRYFYM